MLMELDSVDDDRLAALSKIELNKIKNGQSLQQTCET